MSKSYFCSFRKHTYIHDIINKKMKHAALLIKKNLFAMNDELRYCDLFITPLLLHIDL